jgi:hypothetical protein
MRMVVMMPVAARFVVGVIVVAMVVTVLVAVVMRVAMGMIMIVRVLMPMMFAEHLLRERIVFREGLVVTMLVTAAIRAGFRLERHRHLIHACANALQHIGEHRIVFELQIIRADFNGRMTIAEVIRGKRQRQHIFRADDQHRFGRGDDAHQSAVVGDQHIAVAQHGTAWQQQRDFFAVVERGRKTALTTVVEGERQGRRAFHQHRCQFQMRRDQFVESAHV